MAALPPAGGLESGFEALHLRTETPDTRRLGVLPPVEDGRWIVGVGGMRGGEPEPGEAGSLRRSELLRDAGMREPVATATPAGEVRGFLPGPAASRHDERQAPEGGRTGAALRVRLSRSGACSWTGRRTGRPRTRLAGQVGQGPA